MKEKSIKVGVSIPMRLATSAKQLASRQYDGNLSRVFQAALHAHLAANNALPASDDAELRAVVDGLLERYSLEELKTLRDQRTVEEIIEG